MWRSRAYLQISWLQGGGDQNIKSQNYLFEIVEKSCDKWSKKKEVHIYHTIASSFPQCVNEVLTEWVAAYQQCADEVHVSLANDHIGAGCITPPPPRRI